MRVLAVCRAMTALTADVAAVFSQAGMFGSSVGQLLVALVVAAIVIVVGKFVLSLAWRLVTIGVVVVAALYLLSVTGLI
ncbi:MAG: hypothetical protein A07HR67_02494 [uncultured archaeon A07HR67]|nr:MAG: hypothetical protein A07HR67_02494 [uncultured archaeon A07HR67]